MCRLPAECPFWGVHSRSQNSSRGSHFRSGLPAVVKLPKRSKRGWRHQGHHSSVHLWLQCLHQLQLSIWQHQGSPKKPRRLGQSFRLNPLHQHEGALKRTGYLGRWHHYCMQHRMLWSHQVLSMSVHKHLLELGSHLGEDPSSHPHSLGRLTRYGKARHS